MVFLLLLLVDCDSTSDVLIKMSNHNQMSNHNLLAIIIKTPLESSRHLLTKNQPIL